MEDEKLELETLKETIMYMKKVEECMKICDSITDTEYAMFNFYLQELEDRQMKLEIKINGCIIEEV